MMKKIYMSSNKTKEIPEIWYAIKFILRLSLLWMAYKNNLFCCRMYSRYYVTYFENEREELTVKGLEQL